MLWALYKNNDKRKVLGDIMEQEKRKDISEVWQHWHEPTNFMTLEQFILRLRKDTGDEELTLFDYPVPENEEEYQQALKFIGSILHRTK